MKHEPAPINGAPNSLQATDEFKLLVEQARALEVEQTARHQAETLREVVTRLNTSLDLMTSLNIVLEQLQKVVPYDSAMVVLLENEHFEVICQRGSRSNISHPPPEHIQQFTNISEIIQNRQPKLIPDTLDYPEWVFLPGSEKIRCWLGVPLICNNKFIGILSLYKREPEFYTHNHMEMAQAFASQAAIAIENANLYQRVQDHAAYLEKTVLERTRDLRVLYDVTAVTSQHLDLTTILDKSLTELLSCLQGTMGCIHAISPETHELQLHTHIGFSSEQLEALQTSAQIDNPIRKVFSEDLSCVITPFAAAHVIHPTIFRSFAGIPLHAKGNVVGVLSIFGDLVPTLTQEDLALIASIADHIGVAVENAHLREKAERVAILQERKRIARDLHDSVTQALYSITLFAEVTHDLAQSGDTLGVQAYVQEINTTAHQIFKELRLMLYELRDDSLHTEGLKQALLDRLQAVEGRTGIRYALDVNVPPVDSAVEMEMYRIAQEALNNTLKHAHAKFISIQIQPLDKTLQMCIADDGQGFNPQEPSTGGMGLANMATRAHALGGELFITSKPGGGSQIMLELPLETIENRSNFS